MNNGFDDLLGFDSSKEDCQAAFMPMDVPAPRGPLFVFGEYFLRKFYTVFDRDQNVLGFSIANHDSSFNTNDLNIKTVYDKSETKNISTEIINDTPKDILDEFSFDQSKNSINTDTNGEINLDMEKLFQEP